MRIYCFKLMLSAAIPSAQSHSALWQRCRLQGHVKPAPDAEPCAGGNASACVSARRAPRCLHYITVMSLIIDPLVGSTFLSALRIHICTIALQGSRITREQPAEWVVDGNALAPGGPLMGMHQTCCWQSAVDQLVLNPASRNGPIHTTGAPHIHTLERNPAT